MRDGKASPTEHTPRAGTDRWLGLLGAFAIGSAVALQARINGALAARLVDGLHAAVISFATGTLVVLTLTALLPPARRGLRHVVRATLSGALRWWHLTGGLCGATVVASQTLTVGTLGVAAFTVAIVSGQLVGSLLIDRLGVGPAGSQPVTRRRLLGALLAVSAVGLAARWAVLVQSPDAIAMIALPVLAGIGIAWLQSVNGRVGTVAGGDEPRSCSAAALPATAVNFVTGTLVLLWINAFAAADPSRPMPAEWWLYAGGPLGIVCVGAMVAAVRHLGVFLLGLGMVAGQLIASPVLDTLMPLAPTSLSTATIAGAALALIGAGIATWPHRRYRQK